MAISMSELKALMAVIRRGSFTQAAIDLPLSQPGLSRRISVLEKKLGVQIFDRAAGGVKLTQAGQAFLPYAEEALLQLLDGVDAAQSVQEGKRGSIVIAFATGLLRPSLIRLVRRFTEQNPALSVSLSVGSSSAEVSTRVARAEAAFGLRYRRDPDERLRSQVVGEETVAIVCAPDHPLAAQKNVTKAMLAEQVWIGPDSHSDQETPGFAPVLAKYGFASVRAITVDDSLIRRRLVSERFGIGMFTTHLIADELKAGALHLLTVPGVTTNIPIVIVRRRSSRQGKAEAELGDEIARLFASA